MQLVLNRFNFFFNVSTFLPFPLKPSTHHIRSRDRDVRVRMEWWGILVLFALTAILLKAGSSLTSNVVMQRGRPAKVTKFAREAYWSLAKGSKSYHELLAALQSHAARHIRLNFRDATHTWQPHSKPVKWCSNISFLSFHQNYYYYYCTIYLNFLFHSKLIHLLLMANSLIMETEVEETTEGR